MNFADSPEEARFRGELRAWLTKHTPRDHDHGLPRIGRADEIGREWSRTLHEAGYTGLTWPAEFGGRGLTPNFLAIYYEEAAAADVPPPINFIGINIAGPTIIEWGTEEQKRRHLPRLLAGEEVWCQGFSEPGSGSDLAGLKTRAVLDGDHWVINGQKVWSTLAHLADWCVLLARTDPKSPKHAGLSYLLVDMRSPGIEVRPIRQLTGEVEFNEVFFTDVRVPADSMLGEPGQGWRVAMTTLHHERATSSFALVADLSVYIRHLLTFVSTPLPDGSVPNQDPVIRHAVAAEWAAYQALRFTNYRSLTALMATGEPGPETSIARLAWSATNQRLTKLARDLLGAYGGLEGDDAPWRGYWQREQLRSRGNSIEGGTSEILRNIVAERVLGLPRGR